MAAITSRLRSLNKLLSRASAVGIVVAVLETAVVFALAQRHGLWPLAALVVLAVELWPLRVGVRDRAVAIKLVLGQMPAILVGLSMVLIIAVAPRLATQIVAAVLYGGWRVWWGSREDESAGGLAGLLVVTAVMFEALFLMAAVWRTSEWVILGLVWVCAYLSVYAVLSRREERAAGVMAATWALICAEVSWVLLLWLFTYTVTGGYLLVPQPVLILTALAYCFGSIYVSQRQGSLSRGRLTEYLLIGLILIAIVITGTPWRGSL